MLGYFSFRILLILEKRIFKEIEEKEAEGAEVPAFCPPSKLFLFGIMLLVWEYGAVRDE